MSFWQLIFVLLIFIPIVLLWIFTLVDIFKRHDISGIAKALWAIAILFLPLIGMIVYFVTRPATTDQGALTAAEQAQPSAAPFDPTTGVATSTTADQLDQLASLHDAGKLSDEEFASSKAELLGDQNGG